MNFVIISIYDNCYKYSININGELFDSDTNICKKIYKSFKESWFTEYKYFYNYLLKEFQDYDLIVVCEDGCIDILKGVKEYEIK